MAVQLACTFKRVNIKDQCITQPRCETPTTPESTTEVHLASVTSITQTCARSPAPEEYQLSAGDKAELRMLLNKRLQKQNKQVEFELDPPISNLGLTFIQTNVI